MTFQTLEEWLVYLEQQHPLEIELGLDRIQQVANRLHWDFTNKAIVTVAGTNGKGSFVASLNAILRAHGKSVACYTSPHISQFNERIIIDDEMVADEQLIQAFEKVEQAKQGVSLSYFEFTTLAALQAFSEQESLDVLILEVGLGGRLDAVNILEPSLAVITSIALDHQSYLGESLEAIAAEKAGILREQTPVILAQENILSLLPSIESDARAVSLIQRDFFVEQEGATWQYKDVQHTLEFNDNGLATSSQAAAIVAAKQLLDIKPEQLQASLQGLFLPGRFQKYQNAAGIDFVLDVAHNPQAAKLLKQRLALMPLPAGAKRIAIFNMLDDKDLQSVIEILKDDMTAWFLGELDHPRARSMEEIASELREQGCQMISTSKNLRQALSRALSMCQAGDQIVIFGSFFVVAELLARVTR